MILLLLPLALVAQIEAPASSQAAADSLVLSREQEILSEYGFRDSNSLTDVALKLDISDIKKWKAALGLEPANQVLDAMTLRKLGITPYRALLAQQTVVYRYNELSTLAEVAATLNIPLKKFKSMLGNSDPLDKSWDNLSLQALEINLDTIREVEADFNENITSYGSSVMMVGMLVVFSALILTSLIIRQLVHLNREKKSGSTIKLNSSGQLKSAPKSMNHNVIVAAVTALHMHKMDIEERRKMVLTFRRTPTNQWRASAVLSMPNREMTSVRRPR
jgi:hypothetical protein